MAIKGSLLEIRRKNPTKNKIVIGGIEHPSVHKQSQQWRDMGFEVEMIPVSRKAEYDLEFFKMAVDENTALVSVMLANNELGVLAPLQEMIEWAHQQGALFHSDMVQGLGKLPLDLQKYPVDLASFSSHKIYALKGAGLVFCRKGTPFTAITMGGSQERGRRAGTENLASIASMALMVETLDSQQIVDDLTPLRDLFEKTISEQIAGVEILGKTAARLCNTSCFTIAGSNAESLLMNLDIRGFSVGTGAACSSGNPEPSPVLLGMGLTREEAQSSLRISLGKDTTQDQVLQLAEQLRQVVEHLRTLDQQEVSNG